MKKLISFAIAMFAFATISFAQPGDPGCDPDAQVGTWNVSVSSNPATNNSYVDVYATYSGPTTPYGVKSTNITINSIVTNQYLSFTPWPISVGVPCTAEGVSPGTVLVGTILVSNSSGSQQCARIKITTITNGHSSGQYLSFCVNP